MDNMRTLLLLWLTSSFTSVVEGALVTVLANSPQLMFSRGISTNLGWNYLGNVCNGEGDLWTNEPNNNITLSFTGSSALVYLPGCSFGGTVVVTIDGVSQTSDLNAPAFDCTSNLACDSRVVKPTTNMTQGDHVIVVSSTGDDITHWGLFNKITYDDDGVTKTTIDSVGSGTSLASNPFATTAASNPFSTSAYYPTTSNRGVSVPTLAGSIGGAVVFLIIIISVFWRRYLVRRQQQQLLQIHLQQQQQQQQVNMGAYHGGYQQDYGWPRPPPPPPPVPRPFSVRQEPVPPPFNPYIPTPAAAPNPPAAPPRPSPNSTPSSAVPTPGSTTSQTLLMSSSGNHAPAPAFTVAGTSLSRNFQPPWPSEKLGGP